MLLTYDVTSRLQFLRMDIWEIQYLQGELQLQICWIKVMLQAPVTAKPEVLIPDICHFLVRASNS